MFRPEHWAKIKVTAGLHSSPRLQAKAEKRSCRKFFLPYLHILRNSGLAPNQHVPPMNQRPCRSSLVAQQVKDLVLSLLWLRSLLWHKFNPCPRTSACHGHSLKKKKERKGRFKALSNLPKGAESDLQPRSGSPVHSLEPSHTPRRSVSSRGVQESSKGGSGTGVKAREPPVVGMARASLLSAQKRPGFGVGPEGNQEVRGLWAPGHCHRPGAGGGGGAGGSKGLPARRGASGGPPRRLRLPNYRNHTWFLSRVTS